MLPWKRALGPLAGLLLAVTVTVTPAAAASATTVHPARPAPAKASASGWNDYSCEPSAAHPRPVVLVHGTFGNSVDNWLGLAPYLTHRGYCVFSLDYGQLPGVPVLGGLGPIEASAGQLATYVDKVLAATGAPKADIVGHSQGGMMPNWYLKFLGGAAKTNAMIGIGPDNHGTNLSGLTRMLTYYPEAKDLLTEKTPGLADQIVGSSFLTRLTEDGDTVPGVHYTVISTRYDQVVTPYRSQYLSGPDVHNVLVQDLCPLDLSDHVAIGTVDKVAFHEVANALDPAHATPTTCASAGGA